MDALRMEYDDARDLLYLWFRPSFETAAQTLTLAPGVLADVDEKGDLIGIEVLDASEWLETKPQALDPSTVTKILQALLKVAVRRIAIAEPRERKVQAG